MQVDGRRRWLGGAFSDGKVITFFGTGEPAPPTPGQPRGGVWMATSADGEKWETVNAPPVRGADPGAVAARDGGWIFVTTSEPRRNEPPPPRQPDRN